ncbi:MAG TPA: hypothetical protein VLD36_15290 [Burkholderiales bacterium]|jgi:hypothetical protein|nr:hypothetical protein [Burkholderiales bacterium]
MRGADSRIIEAIVGALLAAALLLAAFAVIAQEPGATDRPVVRVATPEQRGTAPHLPRLRL